MNILVTGGAGYIGSFIVRRLKEAGHEAVILDNLGSGHREAVQGFKIIEADLGSSSSALAKILIDEKIEGVIHMASFIQMGESFKNPGKYFNNNLIGAVNLFEAMREAQVKYVVFSSSAGVYGKVRSLPIKENASKNPENPYGETKLMVEKMLNWYSIAGNLKYVAIRYFNAAGAALDGSIGEDHPEESHIIPLAIKAAQAGGQFTIFGEDYDTPDGTCVRDYVHVLDLAEAHVLAIEALANGRESTCYNAGTGVGISNKQILEKVSQVSGGKLKIIIGQRREGDVDALYASTKKIKAELGWTPKYSDVNTIIESAWKWHEGHPEGYSK